MPRATIAGERLRGKEPRFNTNRRQSGFYGIMLLAMLVVASFWALKQVRSGGIRSPFDPTPTPTRQSASFFMEAQAYFEAGKLDVPDLPRPRPAHPRPM
jgi:hypothetical protein